MRGEDLLNRTRGKKKTIPVLILAPTFTLPVCGLEEHVRVSLIFAIIVSFMLFTVFPLVFVLYFKEFLIHDSRGLMILKKI